VILSHLSTNKQKRALSASASRFTLTTFFFPNSDFSEQKLKLESTEGTFVYHTEQHHNLSQLSTDSVCV
jgi:hypothetical protein